MPPASRILVEPRTLVAVICVGQIVMWTLAPVLTQNAPPLDVVEGYMWGREWLIATYKHPALPSWVLEISLRLTGTTGWPSYLIPQLFVTATYVCIFLLGRDIMGPQRAAAGTLLLAGIAFYAWDTTEFNHNIAEMPFWAALPLALWRAVERRSTLWWLLGGAVAAVGLYAKFSTALLIATATGWILFEPRARRCLATPGPWLGLTVFGALVAPLAMWLVANDFAPFKYAALRSGMRELSGLPLFLLNVLLNIAGLFVIMTVARLIGSKARPYPLDASPIDNYPRRFLLVFSFGPLALALLFAVIARTGLKSAWGSSMFHLLGLLAIAHLYDRLDGQALRRIFLCAMFVLISFPIGYAAVIVLSPRFSKNPMRVVWPQAEIAQRLGNIWARETGLPLRIVAGETWAAGLVGLTSKDRPSLLGGWDPSTCPWVTPKRIDAEGMLLVWDTARPPYGILKNYLEGRSPRQERFTVSHAKRDIVIGYVIVKPKQDMR
jgi:4-amino-4-deoxy-L-arabinose transferase-like glycosyltransferase